MSENLYSHKYHQMLLKPYFLKVIKSFDLNYFKNATSKFCCSTTLLLFINVQKGWIKSAFALLSPGTNDGNKYDLNGFFGNSGYQSENGHQWKRTEVSFTATHINNSSPHGFKRADIYSVFLLFKCTVGRFIACYSCLQIWTLFNLMNF